jgi:hypothetical protein
MLSAASKSDHANGQVFHYTFMRVRLIEPACDIWSIRMTCDQVKRRRRMPPPATNLPVSAVGWRARWNATTIVVHGGSPMPVTSMRSTHRVWSHRMPPQM